MPAVLDREAALKGLPLRQVRSRDRVESRRQLHLLLRSGAPGERALPRRNRRCAAVRCGTQEMRSPTSTQSSSEPGSRYIDFLIPGPAGHEPDELRHVGSRLRAGRNAPAQTAEALRRHAHAPQRFPARPDQQPPGPDGDRSRLLLRLRRSRLSHASAGIVSLGRRCSARSGALLSAASDC